MQVAPVRPVWARIHELYVYLRCVARDLLLLLVQWCYAPAFFRAVGDRCFGGLVLA